MLINFQTPEPELTATYSGTSIINYCFLLLMWEGSKDISLLTACPENASKNKNVMQTKQSVVCASTPGHPFQHLQWLC